MHRGKENHLPRQRLQRPVAEGKPPSIVTLRALHHYGNVADTADARTAVHLLENDHHPALPLAIKASSAPTATAETRLLAAQLLSRLSVHAECASSLTAAPYLATLHVLLDIHTSPHVPRLAARALRNIAALSPAAALTVARNSSALRALLTLVRDVSPSTTPAHLCDSPESPVAAAQVEAVAAVANFARAGLPFQAYLRKHDALSSLCRAAHDATHPALRFHAVRALAEFSLHHNWLVLLISEGTVNIMLAALMRGADPQIASEATRFLGNLATSRIGRDAVLSADGLTHVLARLSVAVCAASPNQPNDPPAELGADLARTSANLCVSSKSAAQHLVSGGGVMTLIDAYATTDNALQTEAFRALLIVAQAGNRFRASVLREIGIKIRQHATHGYCVAPLYDLSRRVKVEATAERKDDFPTTIAGLGARSKQYLFQAGPLATDTDKMPREPCSSQAIPNSVPDLKSPDAAAFRQSARLLSVQRPVLHRDRLARERQERQRQLLQQQRPRHPPLYSPRAAGPEHAESANQRRPRAVGSKPDGSLSSSATGSPGGNSQPHVLGQRNLGRNVGHQGKEALSEPSDWDHIPRCKVIDNSAGGANNGSKGAKGSDESKDNSGNWVLAVWSAVCNAVTRPPNSPNGFVRSGKELIAQRVGSEGQDGASEDVYEMGVPLGRGGFATVYLAKNVRTEQLVAVKRFHPVPATSRQAQRKAEMNARRAMKEQRIWDGLSHKNIVSYKGCFFGESGELNLVAEYVPGWSLADHLAQISKFPEHMVACISQQIVDGLDYLHKCGVTHRDVKPANILVDGDGVIKITDFGVSSAVDVPTMTGNTLVGTPWYIAPEMIEGRPYGKSVDIWSLGCTVLELATGRRPYHHLNAHVALFRMTKDRMPPIPKKLSPLLRDFLKTCWVWDPAQRPTPAHLRRHQFLASVSRPEIGELKNLSRKK